jgi:hypothetical protein
MSMIFFSSLTLTTNTHTHTHTHTQAILTSFNTIQPNLRFTTETEQNNTVNYIDISIHETAHNIRIYIYRKPTFTYTIIPYPSNQPTQHKYSTVLPLQAVQPTVGFSLPSDSLPFCSFFTLLYPPSYSHYLHVFFNAPNPSLPWSSACRKCAHSSCQIALPYSCLYFVI